MNKNNGNGLDRMVKLLTKTNGNGDRPLIHKLLTNYGVFSLTGHSPLGLALFLIRSSRDVRQALDQNDDDSPAAMSTRK